LRVIFMGTPDFAVPAFSALRDRHEVVAVYTQPPRPAGRGQQERPSPIHELALRHGILVRTPASLKGAEVQDEFVAHAADVAVVAAYGLILPRPILAAPRLGCINIHASLLPRWRGAAPIARAIMAGDTTTGISIMQMEAGLDTGPVFKQQAVPIDDPTTAGDLHDILARIGADMITDVLAELARGALAARPQPAAGVTYAAKIDKSEARIDFTRPARLVARHIHGLSPVPGAWFAHGNERVRALRADIVQGGGDPGTVIAGDLIVACGTGAIRICVVQRPGKTPMEASAFLRGYPLPPGTRLE
jgi:methionyl-tRNA formyltransferase